jgi:hypothetical protein
MVNLRTHFGGLGNRLFQLAYVYAQARRGETPDIYLQDFKYFEPYGEELRQIFGQGVEPIDMVSLHVRRGDYIGNDFYTDLCETDYYERAIAEFPEETQFLVFCADRQDKSDDGADKKWVKERFQGSQFHFADGTDEIDDFNKMAGCKGHITANSTFSFWASYVGGGKTVTPKAETWFSDGVTRISIPETWIQL